MFASLEWVVSICKLKFFNKNLIKIFLTSYSLYHIKFLLEDFKNILLVLEDNFQQPPINIGPNSLSLQIFTRITLFICLYRRNTEKS